MYVESKAKRTEEAVKRSDVRTYEITRRLSGFRVRVSWLEIRQACWSESWKKRCTGGESTLKEWQTMRRRKTHWR